MLRRCVKNLVIVFALTCGVVTPAVHADPWPQVNPPESYIREITPDFINPAGEQNALAFGQDFKLLSPFSDKNKVFCKVYTYPGTTYEKPSSRECYQLDQSGNPVRLIDIYNRFYHLGGMHIYPTNNMVINFFINHPYIYEWIMLNLPNLVEFAYSDSSSKNLIW